VISDCYSIIEFGDLTVDVLDLELNRDGTFQTGSKNADCDQREEYVS
jgi:hypothetical protein